MFQKLKKISPTQWLWTLCLVVDLLLIVAIGTQFMVTTVVCGESMQPTLKDKDRLSAVMPLGLKPGDVVLVKSRVLDTMIIKRVIAVPGDTVAILGNTVYRNGLPQTEDYIAHDAVMEDMAPVTLQEDMYFVMGDNRSNSLDSRRIGPVFRDEIRYKTVLKAQPLVWVLRLLLGVVAGLGAMKLADWQTVWVLTLWHLHKGTGKKIEGIVPT